MLTTAVTEALPRNASTVLSMLSVEGGDFRLSVESICFGAMLFAESQVAAERWRLTALRQVSAVRRRLTPRSRGDPPRPAALPGQPLLFMLGRPGKAPVRSGRLSANVRRHYSHGSAARVLAKESMIDTAYCRLMAEYNAWMNAKVYAACSSLSHEALVEDRGAFFKSVYLTLNHIAYSDLAFLSRFTGEPPQVPPLGEDLFGGFASLRTERERLDRRLSSWASALTAEWLALSLTYVSKVDRRERTVPRWVLVTHLFNHQTHHRGQVTTLLSQRGLDVGSTDIPFMPQFSDA